MKRTGVIIGVLLIAALAAALGFFWPFGDPPGTLRLHGIVEIQEVRLGSKVGGRVEKVLVQEGDLVEKGQVLIEFEAPELKAQKKELDAELRKAKLELKKIHETVPREIDVARAAAEEAKWRLEKVEHGWRKEEIKMIEQDLKVAAADREYFELEKNRIADLYAKGSAGKGELDLAVANFKRGKSKYDAAETKLNMVKGGGWEKEKKIARESFNQANANYKKLLAVEYETRQLAQETVNVLEAKLEKLEADLKETKVRAEEKSVVEVISVRAGDLVPPNQPVVRVLRADDLWVKVFVPETELGKVRLHHKVNVLVDSYPDLHFEGEVIQIGSTAEYTPRNIQSKEERRYQVFPIKIRVTDPQGVFKAGMAAEVIVPPAPAP